MSEKRQFNTKDIAIGDIVEFYKEGFRFDTVKKITTTRRTKKTTVFTERYGKIPFEKIREILIVEGKRTVLKPLTSDLFE